MWKSTNPAQWGFKTAFNAFEVFQGALFEAQMFSKLPSKQKLIKC